MALKDRRCPACPNKISRYSSAEICAVCHRRAATDPTYAAWVAKVTHRPDDGGDVSENGA